MNRHGRGHPAMRNGGGVFGFIVGAGGVRRGDVSDTHGPRKLCGLSGEVIQTLASYGLTCSATVLHQF